MLGEPSTVLDRILDRPFNANLTHSEDAVGVKRYQTVRGVVEP